MFAFTAPLFSFTLLNLLCALAEREPCVSLPSVSLRGRPDRGDLKGLFSPLLTLEAKAQTFQGAMRCVKCCGRLGKGDTGDIPRAGEMAQSVKCLPLMHEDLSSIPRLRVKKMGVVVQACHSSAGETETRGILGFLASQSSLLGRSRPVRDLASKQTNTQGSEPLRTTPEIDPWFPHMCTHVHTKVNLSLLIFSREQETWS